MVGIATLIRNAMTPPASIETSAATPTWQPTVQPAEVAEVGLLRFIYPKRQLGAAIGWNAIAIALAGAAGPSIGAAILSVAGWPWLFAINIPIGILALAAAWAMPTPQPHGRRLDLASIGLN